MKMLGKLLASAFACVAAIAATTTAYAADPVKVGFIGSISDAPLFIAIDKGYFKDANVAPEFLPMGSLARQIAPLSSGDIDVAFGAISAGLYNAVSRDIVMKVVADKGQNAPGSGYNAFLVRKDLYDNGTIRSFADFKGRTIATIGVGSSDMSIINEAMKTVGMRFDDIQQTSLTLPNHLVALENKGIEITLTPEPFATLAVDKGLAVRLTSVGEFYPNQQQTVMLYGGRFMKERPDVAQRFMNAYLRGVRHYLSAIKDGHLTGVGADEVIASVAKHSSTKNTGLLRRISAVVIDPNGKVNLDSMKKDWEFLKSRNLIKNTVTPNDIVDMSFVEKATAELDKRK